MAVEWKAMSDGGGFAALLYGTCPLGKLREDKSAGGFRWGAGLNFDDQGRLSWGRTGRAPDQISAEEAVLVAAREFHPEAVGAIHVVVEGGAKACGSTTGLVVRDPKMGTCQRCALRLDKMARKTPAQA